MKKVVFMIIILGIETAFASNSIRFQGRLTDSSGASITGPDVRIQISLYDNLTNGTKLAEFPEKSVVTNEAGLFSTDIDPFPVDVLKNKADVFVEIKIRDLSGIKTMRPRQKLGTVPYAIYADFSLMAQTAETVVDNSITSQKIKDGSIMQVDLATDSINGALIQEKSISGNRLHDKAVGAAQLQNDSIKAIHISTGIINESHIGIIKITSDEIVDGEIKTDDLSPEIIETRHLKNSAVTNEKIKDGSITTEKLSPDIPVNLVPPGMIAMFAKQCPVGWSRFSELDNRFPFATASYTGVKGGNLKITVLTIHPEGSHLHTVRPHAHEAGELRTKPANIKGDGVTKYYDTDTYIRDKGHIHDVVGVTDLSSPQTSYEGYHAHKITSGDYYPPYLGVVFCQKS